MGKSRQRWSRNKRILSVLLLLSLCVLVCDPSIGKEMTCIL